MRLNQSTRLPGHDDVKVRPKLWSIFFVAAALTVGARAASPVAISPVPDQRTFPGARTQPIAFAVGHAETSAEELTVSVSSANPSLVPDGNITLSGSGSNRFVVVTPAPNQTGTARITLTVSDGGGGTATNGFTISVAGFTDIGAPLGGFGYGQSAWGDFDSDGDLDLAVAGLDLTLKPLTKLFRNDGNGAFSSVNAALLGLGYASVAWGDYDNNGDLDLLLAGSDGSSVATRIYRNHGGGAFSPAASPWPGVFFASVGWSDLDSDGDLDALAGRFVYRNAGGDVFTNYGASLLYGYASPAAFGDYDGDGDSDLIQAGYSYTNTPFTRLYANDGRGNFVDSGIVFPGLGGGSTAWGDYDNDGDLDLLLSGSNSEFEPATHLYRNDHPGGFTDIQAGLPGLSQSTAAWGDYDNDGDLDILLAGEEVTKVFRNEGNGVFSDAGLEFPGVILGHVAWGDFDNDGDLDFSLLGYRGPSANTGIMRVYRNEGAMPNTPPSPPTGLSAEVTGGSTVTWTWSEAGDVNQSGGLSYNLRMGTQSGGGNLVGAMAEASTGFRRVPALGNRGQQLSFTLSNVPPGTYHGSVQAIDHAFAGSPFAPEVALSITPPTISGLVHRETLPNTATPAMAFVIGDRETSAAELILVGHSSNTDLVPAANIVFGGSDSNRTVTVTPEGNLPGTATITITVIDANGGSASGGFVVSVAVFHEAAAGFASGGFSAAAWGDYDGDGRLDLLMAGASGPYHNNGDGTLSLVEAGLPNVRAGSIAWADYDNDGDLDFLIAGTAPSIGPVARIYRNDGGGLFTDIQAGLPGIFRGFVDWGDFDNDGRLDFIMAGYGGASGYHSRIYHNNGDGTFRLAPFSAALPPMDGAAGGWADVDNDGDLDLLATGAVSGNKTRLYRNEGEGRFVEIPSGLPNLGTGSISWGDYDEDGLPDLLLCGFSNGRISRLYRNHGGGTFQQIFVALPALNNGSVAWGDYDNDGDLDMLLAGEQTGAQATYVFQNNGQGSFNDLREPLPGVSGGAAAWGDYDNDGDLDIVLTSAAESGPFTRLYRNGIDPANTPPVPPTNLSATMLPDNLLALNWGPSADAQTSGPLNYNVRLGTTPGGLQTASPHADLITGHRRLPRWGNGANTNRWLFFNLPTGTYYWSVQAIDSGFAGSSFSPEATFSITNTRPGISVLSNQVTYPGRTTVPAPFTVNDAETPASLLVVSGHSSDPNLVPNENIVVEGSGPSRTVTVTPRAGEKGVATITIIVRDSSTGSASSSFELRVEEFTDSGVVLPTDSGGSVAWGDYDSDGFLDILLSGEATAVLRNNGNGTFTNIAAGLLRALSSSAVWGDYDNDGDLDIVLMGSEPASGDEYVWVFRNNGNQTFSIINSGLVPTGIGSLAWGDYDNDGDLDLLQTGRSNLSAAPLFRLYANGPIGTFAPVVTNLPGAYLGSAIWGDTDRDGDLDFLITGATNGSVFFPFGLAPIAGPGGPPPGGITRIYRNDGVAAFSEIATGLPEVFAGCAAWGDYDSDGHLDLLLAGATSSSNRLSRIYRNNGNATFSDIGATLLGVSGASAAWGDYDGDGDLDILLTGTTNGQLPGAVTRIYRNDGGSVFRDAEVALPALSASSVAWGDYDNDGDLDLLTGNSLLTGLNVARLYRNNLNLSNAPPTAPGNLSVTMVGRNEVLLGWSPASDRETTNAAGLNYNLRVGTTPGGGQIVSPHADAANGFRRLAAPGNAGHSTAWRLKNLRVGTYHWSVQAIDASWAGSPFAAEATFSITEPLPPTLNPLTAMMLAEDAPPTSRVFSGLNPGDGQDLRVTAFSSNPVLITNLSVLHSPPQATGQLRFQLVTNAWGTAHISIVASAVSPLDSNVMLATTNTFAVTVNPVNDRPVALGQLVNVTEDTPAAITLTGIDADGDPLTYTVLDAPQHGQLSGAAPALLDTPLTNYFGPDVFTFRVSDGFTNSLPAAVSLNITPVPDVATVRLSLQATSDGRFELRLSGEPYQRYRVEASEDLLTWTERVTASATALGEIVFAEATMDFRHRFYRARVLE